MVDSDSNGSSSPKNHKEEEKGVELQENIIENNL
mgnify:FL=1